MRLLIFSGLSDKKLISKIEPIISLEKIEKIYLVRNTPLQSQKIESWPPPPFLNILFLREAIKLLYGFMICISKRIDYVIGIYLRPHGLLAYSIGRILKKPVIQLFVGNDVDLIEKNSLWLQNLLKSARHIGVRGSRSRKRLVSILKEDDKFFIHHNVYSLPNQVQQHSQIPKKIDVICVADFTRVKRIDVFLKVISRVKTKHHDLRAAMVGADGRKSRYEKMRKKMNLDRNVSFLGRVTDVSLYLAQSRVFLLTSEAEGLPMAVIEAMSFGLPCVLPDIGDIPEIAKDRHNALLVPLLDEEAFASRVNQLLEDRYLYQEISRNALKTIEKKRAEFSCQHIQKLWDKILV